MVSENVSFFTNVSSLVRTRPMGNTTKPANIGHFIASRAALHQYKSSERGHACAANDTAANKCRSLDRSRESRTHVNARVMGRASRSGNNALFTSRVR